MRTRILWRVVTVCIALASANLYAKSNVLNIYFWGQYMAPDTIKNFEKETGIKVRLDVYDSNEQLQAKLLTGNTGYDIVAPSNDFLAKQIQSGVYLKIDKNKLSNYKNLDKAFLKKATASDPGNNFSIPYLWGTLAIGYNVDKVEKALGGKIPANSWDLVFKPETAKKLQSCGIALMDSPSTIFPAALNYIGKDPNSASMKDHQDALNMLLKIRPYIKRLVQPIMNDLATGEVCVVTGHSGAVMVAKERALAGKNKINIRYVIPSIGANMWFDNLAIPKDAKNVENAYLFMNYILRPDVIAKIGNATMYNTPNAKAEPLLKASIRNDPMISPNEKVMATLWVQKPFAPETMRIQTRLWQKFATFTKK